MAGDGQRRSMNLTDEQHAICQAARDLDVSLGESFMIGDKASDIVAGLNAGVRACVWITEAGNTTFTDRDDVIVVPDFKSAAAWILSCPEETE